jgi:hypothetical protein
MIIRQVFRRSGFTPNPAHDIAYLQVHSERNAEMEVQIIQLNEKMIRKSAGYIITAAVSQLFPLPSST